MGVKSTSQGWPLATDVAVGDALATVGSAARQELQDVLNSTDSALEKLFADRNTLLADGGTLSWSSGSLTTTTTFKLHINATNGTTPVTKTITGTAFTFDADGKMLYVTLDNRTADSTLSGGNVVANSATLPDPTSTAQDVVLIAKRIGTQLYFRNGVIFDDGQTATMASSGGGSGSGEINVVENSNDATNWAGTGTATVVTTTTAGDLPLAGVSATAIKIAAGAAADYVRYRWTMPAALKQRKLKVEWHQRPASYTAGDFKVEVYKNTTSAYNPGDYTEFSLSTDSSGTSSIPNATGKYVTYFDGDDADYYELRIVRVAGSSTLNIANVIVGPGIQPQGAVVGEWQSYTPTGSWVSNTTYTGKYRRVGDTAEVDIKLSLSGAPTASSLTINLPTGLTIDTNKLGGAADTQNLSLGRNVIFDTGGETYGGPVGFNNTTSVKLTASYAALTWMVDGNAVNATNPITFAAGDAIYVHFTVPIAEWAGSGTTNLAQNDVEYLTNTNTSTGASDTTAFGYGPAGVNIVAVSSAGATIKKRVRAQRPFGSGAGSPVLKVSSDGNLWVEANTIFPYLESGTEFYGMRIVAGGTATTDMDVEFGGDGARGDDPWSNYTSWKWAVVLEQPGVAVGFGVADTTSTGLVPSGAYNRTTTAWTLGATSATTAAGASHLINGKLDSGATSSADQGIALWLGANAYLSSSYGVRSSNAVTGGAIRILSRNADGNDLFQFYGNLFNDSTTTAATKIGSVTNTGAWTLGPTSGLGTAHVLQGQGTEVATLKNTNAADNFIRLRLETNNGTYRGRWVASSSDPFRVDNASNVQVLSVSSSGSSQLGPSSGYSGVFHTLYGGTDNAASATSDYVTVARSAASASTTGGIMLIRDASDTTCGSITINATANSTAYNTSSDARLKTNDESFAGLDLLQGMLPKKYERISNPGVFEYGFYAQELNTVYPQAVTVGGEDPEKAPWQIDYAKVTPVLVKAIQELKQELDEANVRIATLENQ
jgi:hypothetical protein